jgi:hypothetical protein
VDKVDAITIDDRPDGSAQMQIIPTYRIAWRKDTDSD